VKQCEIKYIDCKREAKRGEEPGIYSAIRLWWSWRGNLTPAAMSYAVQRVKKIGKEEDYQLEA
jgi:hypothetical protein